MVHFYVAYKKKIKIRPTSLTIMHWTMDSPQAWLISNEPNIDNVFWKIRVFIIWNERLSVTQKEGRPQTLRSSYGIRGSSYHQLQFLNRSTVWNLLYQRAKKERIKGKTYEGSFLLVI